MKIPSKTDLVEAQRLLLLQFPRPALLRRRNWQRGWEVRAPHVGVEGDCGIGCFSLALSAGGEDLRSDFDSQGNLAARMLFVDSGEHHRDTLLFWKAEVLKIMRLCSCSPSRGADESGLLEKVDLAILRNSIEVFPGNFLEGSQVEGVPASIR